MRMMQVIIQPVLEHNFLTITYTKTPRQSL
jgi:hypothetical protein